MRFEVGQTREWFGAQSSLKFFMVKFLRDPKTGDPLQWLPHYDEWYRIILEEKRSNVESPRGHGKSIFWSYGVPMWDVIRGGADDLIISYSEGQVVELLRMIKNEIESNDFLSPIRPSTKEIWMADKLGFADGGIIRGLGFGTSARGLHPKRIIGDDMLKDSGGMSPEDQERFWFGVVAGMAMPATQIHGIGTPVDFDDLLMKLEENPVYFNWKRPALLADGNPMCPQLFTKESLEFKRKEQGSLQFAREYMLERIDPATQPFKHDYERLYTEAISRDRLARVVTVCDPAYSETDGDFTAIVTVGFTHGNHAYVLEAKAIRREDPGDIVNELFKTITAQEPDSVGIERKKGEAVSYSFNERRTREDRWDFKYVELSHHGRGKDDKSRIGGLVPRWEAGSIHVRPEMKQLLTQIYAFRLNDASKDHDDLVDALAYCFHPDMAQPNAGKRGKPMREGKALFRVGAKGTTPNSSKMDSLWSRLDRRIYDQVAA